MMERNVSNILTLTAI